MDSLLLTCWTSDHRRMQNVQISEKLHHNQGMPNVCSDYPASRGFSLARLLAFTKSFAWLVCRVVSVLTTRHTSHANDFVNAKNHARETSARRVVQAIENSVLVQCINGELFIDRYWP